MDKTKINLLYVTNIPTPYRQHLFNTMAEIFPEEGIEFEVWYMANSKPNRKWKISENSYNYPYTIFKGIKPVIGGITVHLNPGLLWQLKKRNYDIIVIGGMSSPTHWLIPICAGKGTFKIMFVESNLHSVKRKKGVAAKLKKFLLNQSNAYQITGSPQRDYIEYFCPNAKTKPYIKLPNLIDEKLYRDKVAEAQNNKSTLRKEFNINDSRQMWVLPASLSERKGIIPFLKLFKETRGVTLFLLGDGELKKEIKQYINEYQLPVVLVGFVQQKEIVNYYAAADLFVLPSLKDPSPLSPIEAIAAGLPILVSSRIGNLEDVLAEGINGWSYDPFDEINKGKEIVSKISNLKKEDFKKKGNASSNRYNLKFNTRDCIENNAKDLKEILKMA